MIHDATLEELTAQHRKRPPPLRAVLHAGALPQAGEGDQPTVGRRQVRSSVCVNAQH